MEHDGENTIIGNQRRRVVVARGGEAPAELEEDVHRVVRRWGRVALEFAVGADFEGIAVDAFVERTCTNEGARHSVCECYGISGVRRVRSRVSTSTVKSMSQCMCGYIFRYTEYSEYEALHGTSLR